MIVHWLISWGRDKVSKYLDLIDCSDHLHTKSDTFSLIPMYCDTATFMPLRKSDVLDSQFEERCLASRDRVRCLSEKYVVWRRN